jgi:hypothetical protein
VPAAAIQLVTPSQPQQGRSLLLPALVAPLHIPGVASASAAAAAAAAAAPAPPPLPAAASSVPSGRARGSLEPGVDMCSWRPNPLHASAKDPRRQQQPGSSRYVQVLPNPLLPAAAAPVSAPSPADPALSAAQAAPASTLESLSSPDHVWRSNPLRAPPGSTRRVAGAGGGSARGAGIAAVAERGVSASSAGSMRRLVKL